MLFWMEAKSKILIFSLALLFSDFFSIEDGQIKKASM